MIIQKIASDLKIPNMKSMNCTERVLKIPKPKPMLKLPPKLLKKIIMAVLSVTAFIFFFLYWIIEIIIDDL